MPLEISEGLDCIIQELLPKCNRKFVRPPFYSPCGCSRRRRTAVVRRTGSTAANVISSAAAIKQRIPFSPKKQGSSSTSPTPPTISRSRDSSVEETGLPMDCRKMKAPLLTQANGSAQSSQRMQRSANSV